MDEQKRRELRELQREYDRRMGPSVRDYLKVGLLFAAFVAAGALALWKPPLPMSGIVGLIVVAAVFVFFLNVRIR